MNYLLQKEVPAHAIKREAEFPIWAGAPRQYRFDGSTGLFYCGEIIHEVLMLQPIDWRWQSGERWGRNNQAWLDVAFVDSDGVVSQISLKKDSAIALFELFISLKSVNGVEVDLSSIEIGLSAVSRETEDGGTFSVVEIGAVDYLEAGDCLPVQEFASSGRFRWLLVGEVQGRA